MAKLIEKHYMDKGGKRRLTNYQIEFYADERSPKRKRISSGTRDRSAAEHKKLDLERRYAMGLYDPWDAGPSDKPTLAKPVKLFIRRQKRLGRAEGTVTHYKELLRPLKDSLAPNFLFTDVKCRHVEAFLEGCDIGASSTKNYARHFRTFFNCAVKTGYIDTVPFSDDFKEEIASLRDDPLPSHYSLEEFEALCREADKQAASPTMKRYPDRSCTNSSEESRAAVQILGTQLVQKGACYCTILPEWRYTHQNRRSTKTSRTGTRSFGVLPC